MSNSKPYRFAASNPANHANFHSMAIRATEQPPSLTPFPANNTECNVEVKEPAKMLQYPSNPSTVQESTTHDWILSWPVSGLQLTLQTSTPFSANNSKAKVEDKEPPKMLHYPSKSSTIQGSTPFDWTSSPLEEARIEFRPRTSDIVARRLVASHLGIQVSKKLDPKTVLLENALRSRERAERIGRLKDFDSVFAAGVEEVKKNE